MDINIAKTEKAWKEHPFYTEQVVLGVDIGIEGIGIHIRKGPDTLFAQTYLVDLPEAAPLANRRLKRAMRRSRASARHRDFLYREWCRQFGIPLIDGDAKARSDAWKTRFRAATKGVASAEAVSICLRHILGRRGFSYHRDGEDEQQPWGEKTDFASVRRWLEGACFNADYAKELRRLLNEHDWMSKEGKLTEKGAELDGSISRCVAKYDHNPVLEHIDRHLKSPNTAKEKAWNFSFPRDLLELHARDIITKHAQFFGTRIDAAYESYRRILNYQRRKPGALAERKVKRCPYLSMLDPDGPESQPKCAPAREFANRHLNLVEFLALRSIIDEDGARHKSSQAFYDFCLKVLQDDVAAIASKTQRPRLGKDLRKKCNELNGIKAAPDRSCTPNEYFFVQLKDILLPRLSNLTGRANCSKQAAEILLDRALSRGWEGVDLVDSWAVYLDKRRDTEKGLGLYPQVEFLLGRRSKHGKQATPGILRQKFSELAAQGKLGKDTPDIVITEVIRDAARNKDDRKDRERSNKESRAYLDALYEKHGLEEGGTRQQRTRIELFEQQKGRCPYTGADLVSPLDRSLQIDHIYPREMGGTSERVNLVLTTAKANLLKGKRTPHQARADFPDLKTNAQRMAWSKKKLELFLREEVTVPDWGNLTRTSQLARELRDAVSHWLGIKGKPNEQRLRIGNPSGLQTAQCRRSSTWKAKIPEVDGKKDRENPRHHLWDAMVLSHIPPGHGLQAAQYGGIFFPVAPEKPGDLGWEAIDVGPDINAFEAKTKDVCLIHKHRPRKSKQARTEETIYGKREDDRLIVRKKLIDGQGVPAKNAEKWLNESGIPPDRLAKQTLSRFLEQDKEAKPLNLNDGTPVHSVRTVAPKENPLALLPHRNRQGDIIGWKIMFSPYARMEIWQAPGTDKKGAIILQRRFIPSPRGLSSLHRLAKEGKMPWWGKRDKSGDSLRKELIGGSLLPYSRKVCTVKLGDLLRIPYDAKGQAIAPAWDAKAKRFTAKEVAHWGWLRVTSIKSSGQIGTTFQEKPRLASLKAVDPTSTSAITGYRQFAQDAQAKS